jgi:hypothetical protein
MTAKPLSLPTIYHDGIDLFLEYPRQGNAPGLVLRFPFTEGGLHKALRHIPDLRKSRSFVGRNGNIPLRAASVSGKIARIAKSTKAKREILDFSEEQRAAAAEIVRKMKP